MPESKSPAVGSMGWHRLTVPNADDPRRFRCEVIGWTSSPVKMVDDADFRMNLPSSGETVAGVCHARGVNAKISPQ
ncbi:MAG: hypothetical protein L6Q92_14710 [Phycisphaerae bacterium]|nr:hypothetical protein [Phycisphaerae bacterium]